MTEELIPYSNETEYYTDIFQNIRENLSAYDVFLKNIGPTEAGQKSVHAAQRLTELPEESSANLQEKQSLRQAADVYSNKLTDCFGKRTLFQKRAALSMQKRRVIVPAYIIKTFCRDDFMIHCFLLALAGELDTGFGSLYSRYPENDNRVQPTLDFCIRTYTPWQPKQLELLEQYYRDSKENWSLLFDLKEDGSRYPLYSKLILRRNIVSFVMDFSNTENSLSGVCRFMYPADKKETMTASAAEREILLKRITSGPDPLIIFLRGNKGSGRKLTACNYFAKKGRICMCIDMNALEPEQLSEVMSEAKLKNAGICLWNTGSLWQDNEYHVNQIFGKLLAVSPVLFIASDTGYQFDKSTLPAPMAELTIGYPTAEERKKLWAASFQEHCPDLLPVISPRLIDELSGRFTFTPGQIDEIVSEYTLLILQKGYREDLIYQVCMRQFSHKLGEKALRIESRYTWEDLVLPAAAKKQLQNACDQIRYHQQVYDLWGFEEKIAYGRGVSMLFCGAPGTGKTMAAQVIANSLHMELYKVELSSVMSKYIGETQKALNDIFEEVKKSQSILFFDEADALFAKRSEVKGSNDRYANSETAYLLQKMEEYEGIVILATNYIQNFDTAFKRRIKLIIEFTLPEVQQRLEIWKNIFPQKAPMEEIPDFYYLAENFSLSGSNIKNIAVAAAFRAAAAGRGIRMEDILLGIREEISKSGKQIHSSEFREYAQLLEDCL